MPDRHPADAEHQRQVLAQLAGDEKNSGERTPAPSRPSSADAPTVQKIAHAHAAPSAESTRKPVWWLTICGGCRRYSLPAPVCPSTSLPSRSARSLHAAISAGQVAARCRALIVRGPPAAAGRDVRVAGRRALRRAPPRLPDRRRRSARQHELEAGDERAREPVCPDDAGGSLKRSKRDTWIIMAVGVDAETATHRPHLPGIQVDVLLAERIDAGRNQVDRPGSGCAKSASENTAASCAPPAAAVFHTAGRMAEIDAAPPDPAPRRAEVLSRAVGWGSWMKTKSASPRTGRSVPRSPVGLPYSRSREPGLPPAAPAGRCGTAWYTGRRRTAGDHFPAHVEAQRLP